MSRTRERHLIEHANVFPYAARWRFVAVPPLRLDLAAVPSWRRSAGDADFDGWQVTRAEVQPASRLVPWLLASGQIAHGITLEDWRAWRTLGTRPVVNGAGTAWSFAPGTVPTSWLTRRDRDARALAIIARWSWCVHCDCELAADARGFCAWCQGTSTARVGDWRRLIPVGAPRDIAHREAA